MKPVDREVSNTSILIVEDSATQAAQLQHLLETKGYEVEVARNGRDALKIARNNKPSLVITDVVMPEMNGYDLCKTIKNDDELKDIPVVLVTALSGPDDIFRGLECGADNFVKKPYEEKYLLTRIDNVLSNINLRSTNNLQVGVEVTIGNRRHFITAQRQQILDLLISTSEEAMRLNEGLTRSNLTLNGLYRMADGLNRARSEEDVCAVALDEAMELTGVKSGWIYLRDSNDQFRVAASRSLPEALQKEGKLDGTCTCRELCLSGELDRAVRITECARLAEADGAEDALRCHVSVPLWIDQKVGGIMILLDNDQASAFSDEELQTLSVLGAQIGTALDRTHLRDNMGKLVLERTFKLTAEIEERKKVQESQDRLTAILEATTDLVSIVKPGGPLLYLNRGGRRLLGLPETGEASSDVSPDFHPEWARTQLIDEGFPAALRDGSWSGETALLTRQGKEIPVSEVILAHPGRDGESVLFSTTARDITESRLAEERIHTQLDRLRALRAIDIAITDGLNLHVALDILLTAVTDLLRVDAASVLLLNEDLKLLEPAAERGFRLDSVKWSIPLGKGTSGRAALERRTISCADLALEPDFTRATLFKDENFVAHFAVPLAAHDHVNGVLEIFHRGRLDPDTEWLDFLQALAGQAAIAIDVALLFEGLQRSNAELTVAYDATILGWSLAMDLRDKETEGHTQRVTEMSLALARRMGFSESELVHVRRGALLHDIGKMGVPDSVLLKPGALTDEEWVIMRKHPEHAYGMLRTIDYLKASIDIPYCHHEKWDGSGYPRGLKGEQIPLAARMFAMVDVWDALRSDRPYRKALPEETVMEILRKGEGTHFDPEILAAFLELVADEDTTPALGI
jgi:PAS domain S-box-containing protein/putative nucleotidyltransferase with HDIG domain